MIKDQTERKDDFRKDHAIRLFSFVREVVQLKTRTIRSLNRYEQTIWISDIPLENECACAARSSSSADGDTSLSIVLNPT